MSDAHSPEEIKKHVKIYVAVFAALLVLTFVTVAIAYIHLSVAMGVTLAMIIAIIKASLVACYFMHLISERFLIYFVMGFTMFFFAAMMFLTLFSQSDVIVY